MMNFRQFLEGLTFNVSSRGYHHGQSDLTLYAKENDQIIGRIEYAEYEGKPWVQWIETDPERRHEGVATALAKELQRMYPDEEIEWSNSTDDGAGFIKSLPTSFERNYKYTALRKELAKLKIRYKALEKMITKEYNVTVGQEMNRIDDRIWEIEQKLKSLSPGKRRILWNV